MQLYFLVTKDNDFFIKKIWNEYLVVENDYD